jgi:hypothetical protein
MEKQWYDDNAFCVEQKKWGTWDSYDKDGKCILTSLTEEECIRSTRWYLKQKQEGWNEAQTMVKSENSTVGGKL